MGKRDRGDEAHRGALVGGLLSNAFLTLELIPVVYTCWRYAQLRRAKRTGRPLVEIIGLTDAGP